MTGFLDSCCTHNYAKEKETKTQIQKCGEKKPEALADKPEILSDHGSQQSWIEICYQIKPWDGPSRVEWLRKREFIQTVK